MRDKNPVIMGLIGALLLSTPAVAATADNFTDFPSDWSAPALSQAVENGLLNGYDGKINPTGLLTRAQMATMVNRAFGATATASLSGYEDVAPTDWYYEELAKAVQMGTFQGDNGALRPNQPITREQAFAVLARAFVLEAEDTDALNTFPDKGEVSSWAANAVAALVENGYVTGSNGKLNPKSQITRAEFAQVISNLAGTYVDQSGPAARMVAGNVIVRGDAVSLDHLTVHGDLILADGAANVSLDNVRVTGRIVIRGGGEGVQHLLIDISAIQGQQIFLHQRADHIALPPLLNFRSSGKKSPEEPNLRRIGAADHLSFFASSSLCLQTSSQLGSFFSSSVRPLIAAGMSMF